MSSYVFFALLYLNQKIVYLTFDDGPAKRTPICLDILKKEKVKATFFVNTVRFRYVHKNRSYVIREIREGHSIGNHTYNHPRLSSISLKHQEWQIVTAHEMLRKIGVKNSLLFRPPSGLMTRYSKKLVKKMGYRVVMWDIACDLLYKSPGSIFRCVVRQIKKQNKNKVIVLLHENQRKTLKALPRIIRHFKKIGYKFGKF